MPVDHERKVQSYSQLSPELFRPLIIRDLRIILKPFLHSLDSLYFDRSCITPKGVDKIGSKPAQSKNDPDAQNSTSNTGPSECGTAQTETGSSSSAIAFRVNPSPVMVPKCHIVAADQNNCHHYNPDNSNRTARATDQSTQKGR